MYTRLNLNRTQKYYREVLNRAIEETQENYHKYPSIAMYKGIYEQLLDLKRNLIEQNDKLSENELYNRYSFGAIAAKNFDLETDEYAQKLSDSFGGAFDYHEMPEE